MNHPIATPLAILLSLITCATSQAQSPLRNPSNGHYYAMVVLPTPISWKDANDAARNSTFKGMPGYLATITSAQENNFLVRHIFQKPSVPSLYSIWLGGFRFQFTKNSKSDWRWVTGEPWEFSYWTAGEPNNAWDIEDRLMAAGNRTWNDLPDDSHHAPNRVDVCAYVVEYGKVTISNPARSRRK